MYVVPLADAKAHLNMTGTANDAELGNFLDSATELVQQEAGLVDVKSYVETLPVVGGAAILSHTPVVAVASVTAPGETLTGWAVGPYGRLTGVSGWRWVTVAYDAGTALAPARAHTAILMVTARLWESQRGNTPTALQGGEQPTYTPGLQGIIGEIRALLGSSGLGVVV